MRAGERAGNTNRCVTARVDTEFGITKRKKETAQGIRFDPHANPSANRENNTLEMTRVLQDPLSDGKDLTFFLGTLGDRVTVTGKVRWRRVATLVCLGRSVG